MWSRINCVLVVLVFAFIQVGCSEESNSAECVASDGCETYTTCISGACVEQACTSSVDCPTTDVCVQNLAGQFVCTAIECQTADECLPEEICLSNVCVPTGTGACLAEGDPCFFPNDCCSNNCDKDTKLCIPEAGCLKDEDCDEGFGCNTETGECEEAKEECNEETCPDGVCNDEGVCEEKVDVAAHACMGCESDADCGTVGACLEFSAKNYCFPTCETHMDCGTGFDCISLDGTGLYCVPETKTCEIPCISGCTEEGQICDQVSGECVQGVNLCGACEKDYQCGEGNRCAAAAAGSDRICVPQCTGQQACDNGGLCSTVEELDVCLPLNSENCCFGPECECGNNNCGGEKPECLSGTTCVECLNASQCAEGCSCDANNVCVCPDDVCGGCEEPQICNPDTKECVTCVSNDQCDEEAGQFCNPETGTCEVDICAACQDPYPACAEINGQISCVQCVEDADCASGDCNETTYFCEGSSGILADTCKCTADADCPTGTQFNLKCDTTLGLCYDIDGNCDGISACCDVASGSECIPQLELLAEGIELPIPDLGGSTGVCKCTSNELTCLLTDNCGNGKCPGGIECSANIIGGLLGLASGEFPADFCGEF